MMPIQPGMLVEELPTPCLIIDLGIMERNISRWQAAISNAGCALRPHIKTHKIPEIEKLQIAAGARGITAAKISEAEVFARAGFDDIYIAYPIIGEEKWRAIFA